MKTFTPMTSAALATLLALAMSGANAAGDSMSGSSMSGERLTPQQEQDFQTLDANSDGQISQDEAKSDPQLAKQFTRVDNNSDNHISKGEFARFEAQSRDSHAPDGQSQRP